MIDYMKIAKNIEYFENHDFIRLEAPWWVSPDIMKITAPSGTEKDYFLKINNKCLVASAEQSFLYMANKGRLPKGQWQSTTPCFRNESIGTLHRKCFIKNELIKTDKVNPSELEKIIELSFNFFSQYIDKNLLEVKKTEIGFDIEAASGLELGSYGIRECAILKWIYATGCAEPRLSRAIKMIDFNELT
tara:strand:- start:3969 stop:4535 length:567 start_codon:yes stop_codon:yes gene_type:complete